MTNTQDEMKARIRDNALSLVGDINAILARNVALENENKELRDKNERLDKKLLRANATHEAERLDLENRHSAELSRKERTIEEKDCIIKQLQEQPQPRNALATPPATPIRPSRNEHEAEAEGAEEDEDVAQPKASRRSLKRIIFDESDDEGKAGHEQQIIVPGTPTRPRKSRKRRRISRGEDEGDAEPEEQAMDIDRDDSQLQATSTAVSGDDVEQQAQSQDVPDDEGDDARDADKTPETPTRKSARIAQLPRKCYKEVDPNQDLEESSSSSESESDDASEDDQEDEIPATSAEGDAEEKNAGEGEGDEGEGEDPDDNGEDDEEDDDESDARKGPVSPLPKCIKCSDARKKYCLTLSGEKACQRCARYHIRCERPYTLESFVVVESGDHDTMLVSK